MNRNLPILILVTVSLALSSCGAVGSAGRLVKSTPYRAQGLMHGTLGQLRGAVAGTKTITRRATNTAAQGAAIAIPIAATVATGGL